MEPEQIQPEVLEVGNNNKFKMIGIVDDHYVVKTHKGLKKS